MENRAYDHMFGCMDLPGADSGATMHRNRTVHVNEDGSKVEVVCGEASYVCNGGTGYDTWAGKFGQGGNPSLYPYSRQSDANSFAKGADSEAIQMFSPQQLPVKSAIAREFGVFNQLFSAVPSASTPNHLMTQSATSCGIAENIVYNQCGGKTATFPQTTIYDSLHLSNVSFGFYINTTVPKKWDILSGGWAELGDANYPDVMMDGIARHKENFHSFSDFFLQAENGSLPNFVWIAPNNSNSDHPCNDVAKGERLLKDVYESVRNGPGWE